MWNEKSNQTYSTSVEVTLKPDQDSLCYGENEGADNNLIDKIC